VTVYSLSVPSRVPSMQMSMLRLSCRSSQSGIHDPFWVVPFLLSRTKGEAGALVLRFRTMPLIVRSPTVVLSVRPGR
jgi:hypothetical protein